MKTYKEVTKMFFCLGIMLLCLCGCANQPKEDVQIVKLMIRGPGEGNDFVFNLHSDGTLEAASLYYVTVEGSESLDIEDFSDCAIEVKSKKLTSKERKNLTQLITDVKNYSDSKYQPNVEDAVIIIAKIDEETYLTTYYDEWPDGNVDVRNLTHRLVELSPVNMLALDRNEDGSLKNKDLLEKVFDIR